MKGLDKILALFYSDENNHVFDTVKYHKDFSTDQIKKIQTLPFKFLGPVFFSDAAPQTKNWIIDLVETSLTLDQNKISNPDILQTCFLLNSSKKFQEGLTNLFCLVASPFTENIELINKKMRSYIHPSILQGKMVNESLYGEKFNYHDFMKDELRRGINLLEFSLGKTRRTAWRFKKKYYCVGLIKRSYKEGEKLSELYTFDTDYLYKKLVLDFIPSFYIMCILPDFYEKSFSETLKLFEKKKIEPHIRMIKIHQEEKEVLYLEENKTRRNAILSYGVILIPETKEKEYLKETAVFVPTEEIDKIPKQLSFFKKALRDLLDEKRELIDTLRKFNPNINPVEPWPIHSEKNLEDIQKELDVLSI